MARSNRFVAAQEVIRGPRPCQVARAFETWQKDLQQEFLEALDDKSVMTSTIMSVLGDSVTFTYNTLSKHRRGQCQCTGKVQ